VRSVGNVLREIEYLIKKFNAKGLLFRDPLFTLDKKRAKEIALGILERDYRLKWACETRPDLLDEDLLEVFYKSGLRVIPERKSRGYYLGGRPCSGRYLR